MSRRPQQPPLWVLFQAVNCPRRMLRGTKQNQSIVMTTRPTRAAFVKVWRVYLCPSQIPDIERAIVCQNYCRRIDLANDSLQGETVRRSVSQIQVVKYIIGTPFWHNCGSIVFPSYIHFVE